MKTIKIGTRNSTLAMCQSNFVKDYLIKEKGIPAELVPMVTTGDRILDRPLDEVGGKGLFMKELDQALKEKTIDLAVHSLKDVVMDVPEEYPILGVSGREDPRDVLVLREDLKNPDFSLPVGTSSKRRALQFKKMYPNAILKGVRGNIATRLKRLDEGEYGALILAAAGLKRLGLEKRISRYFEVDEILPAAGQGVLAVQGRADFNADCLKVFFQEEEMIRVLSERSFVRTLNGGCTSPIAAYSSIKNDEMEIIGLYYEESMGDDYLIGRVSGNIKDGVELGRQLAERLREKAQRNDRR